MPIDLSSLNPAQRDAVTHKDGPLLVIAGPGSGKTRVITNRIAYLIEHHHVNPWSILAVTFTNKAAGEMRERVAQFTGGDGPTVSTFHSFGARFLRQEHEAAGIDKGFTIFDQNDCRTLVKKICKELGIDKETVTPSEVLNEISKSKNDMVSPEDYLEKAMGFREEHIGAVYTKFRDLLMQNSALDFDDLLLKTVRTLADVESVRERWSSRYQYMLVDEYQDTNHVQYKMVRLLGAHGNVCVTGDPDQSIYSWRGADLRNILDFEHDFEQFPGGVRTVVLGQNYRSTQTIVRAADHLVRFNQERIHKELTTDNDEGTLIRVMLMQNETHEAIRVGETIRDLVNYEGLRYNQVAIFYRTNAQSRALEQAMREAAIPYVLVGAIEFYKRKEILDVFAWLRLIINPQDEIAFARAIGAPKRGVGATSLAKIISHARAFGMNLIEACLAPELLKQLRGKSKTSTRDFGELISELHSMPRAPVADLLSSIVHRSGIEDFLLRDDPLKGSERVENVNELISDAAIFDEQNEGMELGDYLEQVSLMSDTDKWDVNTETVSLMSMHAAKGLEFPAVFITGFEDGLLPHQRSIQLGPDEMEEERRLLYVGITRAQSFLHISLCRTREQFGQAARNAPSRFLTELPQELLNYEDCTGGLFGFGSLRGGQAASTLAQGLKRSAGEDVPFDIPSEKSAADEDDVPFDIPDEDDTAQPDPWEDADTGGGLRFLPGGKTQNLQRFKHQPPQDAPILGGARPEAAPGGMSQATLKVGDKVRHAMFGIGTIMSFTKHAGGTRAKILFQGWGEKNLALEYAKLTKV